MCKCNETINRPDCGEMTCAIPVERSNWEIVESALKRPDRHFEVEIKLGGDTWEDVIERLEFLVGHFGEKKGQDAETVMGGVASHAAVFVQETCDMTNEKYHAALREWIRASRIKDAMAGR